MKFLGLILLLNSTLLAASENYMAFIKLKYNIENRLVYKDDQYGIEQKAIIVNQDKDYCQSKLLIVEKEDDYLGSTYVRLEFDINWGELLDSKNSIGFGEVLYTDGNKVLFRSLSKNILYRQYDLNTPWDFTGGELVIENNSNMGHYNLKFITRYDALDTEAQMGTLILNCLR